METFLNLLHRLVTRFVSAAASLAVPLIVLYVSVPILFYLFPATMQRVFFLNFVKVPGVNYDDLTYHGVVSRGRNFYLDTITGTVLTANDKNQLSSIIGVWHILPSSLSKKLSESGSIQTGQDIERLLNDEHHGIFIYFHGNSFDRAQYNRIQIYNTLSELDYHVVAIDYRGYGDSSGHPSEDILVNDSHAIIQYVRKQAPHKEIYVWGHSMGSGVATRVVAELSDDGKQPRSLILESPFNNLKDVIRNHWFIVVFAITLFSYTSHTFRFDQMVVESLIRSGLVMSSDESIKRIKCPILVLHAEDDHIIPIKLAHKLVNAAKKANRKVEFVEFEAGKNYFHKYLHTAPEFKETIRKFTTKSQIVDRSRNRKRNVSNDHSEDL